MIPASVINYYSIKNKVPFEKSQQLFNRLENFFLDVVAGKIKNPTNEIDDAWHTFILHTQLYNEYCVKNFGSLIHHYPLLNEEINCSPEEEGGKGKGKDCDAAIYRMSAAPCESGGGDNNCDAQHFPS